jgi:hypothetical protein
MKLNLSSGTNIWNVPSSNSKKALTTSPSARFQALVMQFQLMSSVSCQQDHKTFKPTGLSPVHWQSLQTGITGSRQNTVIKVRAYGMKSCILQEWKLVLWWNAHIFQMLYNDVLPFRTSHWSWRSFSADTNLSNHTTDKQSHSFALLDCLPY